MPTIYREGGFVIRVYPKDHEPPHVHISKAGSEVKIAIGDKDAAPALLLVEGMSKQDARKALAIVEANQGAFMAAWRKIHGT